MGFFKKNRSGGSIGGGAAKGKGKKISTDAGPQHHFLGNDGTNGKIPITKKAKNILD